MSWKRVGGLSLLETVLALFLLIAEVLVLLGAFHQGVRHQARTRMQARALGVLQRNLSEVRAWAEDPVHFRSAWSPYASLQRVDAVDPDFRVEFAAQPAGQPLAHPALGLEAPWLSQARTLRRSVVAVKVTAIWDPSQTRGRMSAVTYIGEPARTPNPTLQITQTNSVPTPVARFQKLDFEVRAEDSSGRPLDDLQYTWSVKPLTGNATVLGDGPRDGSRVQVQHVYYANGREVHVGGLIQVQCRAVYHGRELLGTTGDIQLQ